MTMLLENRTISMILTVPNVKELSHSVKNLQISKPPSIPIYHGSIIHIEQHQENENTSDLIVRVPNFHHLPLPSVTISTIPINDDQLSETESQREARIKRRAPICPIRNDTNNIQNTDSEIKLTNAKRLAIGLRNLRQTIITNYKSKRSTNINKITIIPVLPDVEVIAENLQKPTIEKKSQKHHNLTSKFLKPKILFIKRKYFKIRKKQLSSKSSDSVTNAEDKTIENSTINISVKDQEGKTNIPISLVHPESSSTHHYSGVSQDFQTNSTEDISSSTNIHLPETYISNAKLDLRTDIQPFDHIDEIDEGLYVVHSNEDTYSECYEVTYEYDPEYQHFIDHEPEIQDQPSIKINLDPFEYQDLTSSLTTWLPIFSSNNYDQIDQPHSESQKDSNLDSSIIPRVKFQSFEDLSETSHDQTLTYQPESISGFSSTQENNQIMYLNDSSIINEDYTVILQFLKRVLQIEANSDDDSNEFNKEINQLFQTDKVNEFE